MLSEVDKWSKKYTFFRKLTVCSLIILIISIILFFFNLSSVAVCMICLVASGISILGVRIGLAKMDEFRSLYVNTVPMINPEKDFKERQLLSELNEDETEIGNDELVLQIQELKESADEIVEEQKESVDEVAEESNELKGEATEESNEFKDEVTEEPNELKGEVTEESNEFKDEVTEELNEFKDEVTEELNEFKDEVAEELNEFKDEVTEESDEFKNEVTEESDEFKDEVIEESDEFKDEVAEESDEFKDEVIEESDEFKDEVAEESDNLELTLEEQVFEVIKVILRQNHCDIKDLSYRTVGTYLTIYVKNRVMIRLKLTGRKQYVLTYLSEAEVESLGLMFESPSKSEAYTSRIQFTSIAILAQLESHLVKMYQRVSK